MYPYTDVLMKEVWELCPFRSDPRGLLWTDEFDALLHRWQVSHDQWRKFWPANDQYGMAKWGLDAEQATYLLVLPLLFKNDSSRQGVPFDQDLISELFPTSENVLKMWGNIGPHLDEFSVSELFKKMAEGSWWSNGEIRLLGRRKELVVKSGEIPRLNVAQIKGSWEAKMGQVPAYFASIDDHIREEGGYDEDAFLVNWSGSGLNVYLAREKTLLHFLFTFTWSISYTFWPSMRLDDKVLPPKIVSYNLCKDVQRVTREGNTVRLQFYGEHIHDGRYVRNGPLSLITRDYGMAKRLHDYLERYRSPRR
jgi:hypothetical protein